MNTSTKIQISFIVLFLLSLSFFGQSKRQNADKRNDKRVELRTEPLRKTSDDHKHALRIIRRTSAVLVMAHRRVKEHGNYTGDLGKAVAHQRFSKRLYSSKHFHAAAYQSRRARLLAFRAIRDNQGMEPEDYVFDQQELGFLGKSPNDAELDQQMTKEYKGKIEKDEDLIKGDLTDIDINEQPSKIK